jgi:hypothetical protein
VLPSLIFIIDTGSEAAEAGGEDPEGGDGAAEEGAPGLRGLQGDCLLNFQTIPTNQTKPWQTPHLTNEKKPILEICISGSNLILF